MKSLLNCSSFAFCAIFFILVVLSAEFVESSPLVRRRRYTSLSEQTLAAHYNRHKNAKSTHGDSSSSNAALVADGVFETEEKPRLPDADDLVKLLNVLNENF